MKIEDVGMANTSLKSTETRDELLTTCNPMSRCTSAPDATAHFTASRTIVNTRKMVPTTGRAHSLKLFCMYDKRFEISKTK